MSSLRIRSEILRTWYSTVRYFRAARSAQVALLSPESLIFPELLNLCSPPGTMPCGPLKPAMWLMRMLASVGRLGGKLAADPDFEDLVRRNGVSFYAGVSSFFCSASLLSLRLEYSTSWCDTTREPTFRMHVWGCYTRIFAAFSWA